MNSVRYYLFLIPLLFASNVQAAEQKDQSASISPLILNVDQYSENISANTLETWTTHSNFFSLSSNKSEFENISYCPVNEIFCSLTLTAAQREHLRLFSGITTNNGVIQAHLEDLARKVNRDPEDAKFTISDGKVTTFTEAKNGLSLNISESLALIVAYLNENNFKESKTIALNYTSIKPAINYADVNNLGISSLIGEGTSNYKGSTINRIKNIKIAVERFNGTLIKPGSEFSFVKILGEVDEERGYFPELVIKKNATELDFGGGVCQVSTTVFRAAIYSGLKITARRNHAYPVSYYNPQGMDATVFVPNPDLRFMNNTPNHILVQAKITGTELVISFYGTNDGRKTTVDGPYITEKQPDGSMKTKFTQTVVSNDGTQLINDVFNSSYDSPYRYPHPGGVVLTAKPANWSDEEWKSYKKAARAAANIKPQ